MPNHDEKTGGLSGKTTALLGRRAAPLIVLNLFLILTLSTLTAGCIGPDDAAADLAAHQAPDPWSLTVWNNGTLTAGIGLIVSISQGGATLDLDVPEDAATIEAALDWDGPFDLDLCLSSPSAGTTSGVRNCDHGATGGAPASPDGPLLLTINAPEAGLWQASPSINLAAADTDYRLRLTATGPAPAQGPPEP